MEREVYLDNAATTRVDPQVADAMVQAMTVAYGNPSSAHRLGAAAARLLAEARQRMARALGARPEEVSFTSGGTEANALGVRGAAEAARGRHLVVSGFEHPSVAETAQRLSERGFEVTVVAPERSGVIDAEQMARAVRADTAVCALLWVQNELGTVQPVAALARAVKARAPRCHVHVDAVQAFGKLPIEVESAPFDSLAVSAHKIHGPKGAGALWLRRAARVQPLVFGGGQERGLRPGTEGVPGAIGLGLAAELAERARPEAAARMARLGEQLWDGLAGLDGAVRLGQGAPRAPHIFTLGLPGLPAEPLLHALEARGVYVSAGSACHARERKPSATLRAIGLGDDIATLRFSFSRLTTEEEVAYAVEATRAAARELA